MNCKNCGANVEVGHKFCQNCGQSVEIQNNTNVETITENNQQQTDINMNMSSFSNNENNTLQNNNFNNNPSVNSNDGVNVLLVIVSFLFPLVGIIIFIATMKNTPKNAKACGLSALISTILSVIVSILIVIPVISTITKSMEDIERFQTEETYDYNNNDDEKVEETKPIVSGNISNNWKEYQVSYNGKIITLPVTYKALSETTGFQLKQSQSMSYLDNKYYTLANLYKNEQLALYTEIANTTGAMAQYKDCNVTRVAQSKYMVSKGIGTMVFPGGLKAGDKITENEIVKLFGEPTDKKTYSADNYNKITYIYNEDTTWTTQNYYEIEILNGEIDQLTLDNR